MFLTMVITDNVTKAICKQRLLDDDDEWLFYQLDEKEVWIAQEIRQYAPPPAYLDFVGVESVE